MACDWVMATKPIPFMVLANPTRVGDPRTEGGPLPVPDPDATRVGDPRTEGGRSP